ncbi:fibronectin type III domain-containing protein [Stygiolobus azoricus]|uniref:Fibronectin n=1 Tax=Stygiolobus azoricus TaxID=41675 RepID=A0A650CL34_9CREN|nr:fibronectin type III domain-containing protein [Stygiolobus azoricus]QGR18584.1 fibronectin [Stygiolobus azoricus]
MRKRPVTFLLILSLLIPIISMTIITHSDVGFRCQDLPSLPIAVQDPAVVYFNNSIYVIGGMTQGPSYSSAVFIYSHGRWTQGPSLPFPLIGARAVVYNGSIYVVGGLNISGIFGGILKLQGDQWVIVSNSMPRPVYDEGVIVYDNQLYVVGGANFTGLSLSPPSNLIQVYSFSDGSWRIIGKTPQPLSNFGYFFNGSVLFVVGGYVGYASTTASVYEYFPFNNSWVQLPSLASGIEEEAVGYYEGTLFFVGGYYFNYGIIQPGVIAYLYNNTWHYTTYTENVPTEDSGYVQVGNTLYIVGGALLPPQIPTDAFQSVEILLPPPAPKIVYYAAGNETATIVWSDNDSIGYYINYWSSNGQKGSIMTYSTSYTFTNLTNGVKYYFQIIPFNQQGNGTSSQIVVLTPFSVPNPPIIHIKLGDRNATVSWKTTFNGGFPILGYYLFLEGGNITFAKNLGNITSYIFTNLTPSVVYKVGVIAYNQIGNSSEAEVEFVAVEKASVIFVVSKLAEGLLVSWNSTQPSKFILIVTSGTKVVANLTLTNYSVLLKIPFGIYNITLEAINQAGVTTTSAMVSYYIKPEVPDVVVNIVNNYINASWPPSPYAQYYLVYVNNTLVANTTKTSVLIPLSDGYLVIKIIAANAGEESTPYVEKIAYYSSMSQIDATSTYVNSNFTLIRSITPPTTSITDVSINITTAIVVISLFLLSLVIVLVILEKTK